MGAGERVHAAAASPRVHVLAGGGSGELLMRALADAGVPFSAGPLNAGDSDAVLARRLAALTLEEPPYAPVSPAALDAACERMRAVEAVIVCPMPLGPGNIALLEAARQALAAGTRVLLLEPEASARAEAIADTASHQSERALDAVAARDFSGRGVEFYRALEAAGAEWVGSNAEAVAGLDAGLPAQTQSD